MFIANKQLSNAVLALNGDVELGGEFVHARSGVADELCVIPEIITMSSSARISVMVDNAHIPTLILLRTMKAFYYLSGCLFKQYLHDSAEFCTQSLYVPGIECCY